MKVAASIVACDFSNLKSELSKVNAADYIHFDVMDGHFVPNITIGPDILKAVKKCTKLPVNAHLMVSDPKNFVSAFSAADSITVHVEANDVDEAISKIKRQKQKIGLALNPETSVHDVQPYLKDIDFILVMTVNPGFSGQEFIEKAAQKTKLLRPMGKEIWVDGGINAKTKQLVDADVLCAGNYIFASKNPEEAIARLQQ